MTSDDRQSGEERSETPRRDDDKIAAEYIANTIKVIRRGPPIVLLIAGALTGATATQALVTKSELDVVHARIDSLLKTLHNTENERRESGEKLDLLLRLACPSIKQPDLVRECRNYTRQ